MFPLWPAANAGTKGGPYGARRIDIFRGRWATRTVCSDCGILLIDGPLVDGTSHGICPACRDVWRQRAAAVLARNGFNLLDNDKSPAVVAPPVVQFGVGAA